MGSTNMFCWFLADVVCSMPLSFGTLENLCHKNMVKSNIKIKIAFTNCYTGIIILTFLVAGNLASAGINSRFFCELTAFMTVVNIAAM